jgi:two-component system chemotaxis response regulator CheY
MNELLFGANDLKIVVVDDSDFSRSIIVKMLNGAGYKVVGESASAANALQVIKEKNPNVVITDIVMPEISGIELTEKINQDFDNIYVIVISSLSQEHVVLEAIGAGAADFISKPISEQQLVDSLSKILAQINKDKK